VSLAKNTIEGRAEPFLQRIESLYDDLESERGSYMERCRTIRDDIKIVLGEAADAGIPKKALKGLVKFRALKRKQNAIAFGIEDDEAKIYEQLIDALGDLGIAAARRAGYAPEDDGDERDLRPRHLRQPDAATDSPAY